jgi:hypothetical protein
MLGLCSRLVSSGLLSSSVVVIVYYKEVCDSRLKKARSGWESVFFAGAQPPLGARVGIQGFVWVILLVVQKQVASPVASPRVASIRQGSNPDG